MRARGARAVAAAIVGCLGVTMATASAAGSSTPAGRPGPTAEIAARVIPIANFALPPSRWGCGHRTPGTDGAISLPVTVSKVGNQVAVLTNLCINASGPQPFVVDTGASQSEIDSGLATRLHLAAAGDRQQVDGVGCTGPAQPRQIDTWSWEGVPLDPQQVMGVTIPGMGGRGQPVGLLGSDVLSRFGSVRFDFTRGTMTLPGPEGPAQASEKVVTGPTTTPTPPSLLDGTSSATVPLKVETGPAAAEVIARVRVGTHRPRPFVVDTGSSQSVVSMTLQKAAALRATKVWERQETVCSTITIRLYASGPWAVGTAPLVRGPVGSVTLGPVSGAGYLTFDGLLGSDQLVHFGWVVFDYAGGRLVLGTP